MKTKVSVMIGIAAIILFFTTQVYGTAALPAPFARDQGADRQALMATLWTQHYEAPTATALALAEDGSPEALAELIRALAEDKMSGRRHAAMVALEQAGDAAVPPLCAALASPQPILRRNAAEVLGWIASPQAVPCLIAAQTDENDEVRGMVAWALGQQPIIYEQ